MTKNVQIKYIFKVPQISLFKSKRIQKPREVNGALEHYTISTYAHWTLANPEKSSRIQFWCSYGARRAGKSKSVEVECQIIDLLSLMWNTTPSPKR